MRPEPLRVDFDEAVARLTGPWAPDLELARRIGSDLEAELSVFLGRQRDDLTHEDGRDILRRIDRVLTRHYEALEDRGSFPGVDVYLYLSHPGRVRTRVAHQPGPFPRGPTIHLIEGEQPPPTREDPSHDPGTP